MAYAPLSRCREAATLLADAEDDAAPIRSLSVRRRPAGALGLGGLDLREFATAGQLAALTTAELLLLLERVVLQRARLDVVEQGVLAELRQRAEGPLVRAPLLRTREAARRLGMSPDWVRAHGAALGIAVPLDGVVRYDPAAVERLRQRRARRDREPPRD